MACAPRRFGENRFRVGSLFRNDQRAALVDHYYLAQMLVKTRSELHLLDASPAENFAGRVNFAVVLCLVPGHEGGVNLSFDTVQPCPESMQ